MRESVGASDDIRRATELAYRAVSEFGMSASVGPLAVASMGGGGDDGSLMLRDSGELSHRADCLLPIEPVGSSH